MKKRKAEMLTIREAAKRIGAAESSVRLWVRRGRFPGARLETSPVGSYLLIPDSDLDNFEMGSPGRPPKPKTEKKGKAQ